MSGAPPILGLQDEARCLDCKYLLRGLDTPRCPECGRVFDPGNPLTFDCKLRHQMLRKRPVGRMRRVLGLVLLMIISARHILLSYPPIDYEGNQIFLQSCGWLMWGGLVYATFVDRAGRVGGIDSRLGRWLVGALTIVFFSTSIGWASCPHADQLRILGFTLATPGTPCRNEQEWHMLLFQSDAVQRWVMDFADSVVFVETPLLGFALLVVCIRDAISRRR